MPETPFSVRWPDGRVEICYSPSTVIQEHLETGRAYSIEDFVAACRRGLEAASERVRAIYGTSGCSLARAQLSAIEATAERHARTDNALVHVEGFGLETRKRA